MNTTINVRLPSFFLLLLCLLLLEKASTEEAVGEKVCNDDDKTCSTIPPLPPVVNELMSVAFGKEQQVAGASADTVLERLQAIQKYMYGTVYPTMNEIGQHCQLNHEHCTFWATIGECEANPKYMKVECAPACYTCDNLAFETRCPLPKPEAMVKNNTWQAGDLNKMFHTIVTNFPHTSVLLQPGMKNPAYEDSPWVVVMDDFLTPDECQALIDLGTTQGYERSKDVGAKKFDGTYDALESTGRTSSNAWCVENCFNHTVSQSVLKKIENLTGVPDANSEYLQLLQYGEGQFYKRHHDYIPFHLEREQGVRILTVFLYLNDVEQGGGTNFPDLQLTVEPKKGRILLWPSVLDEDPDTMDPRTHHQALPVEKGVKYGANAWLHQRDFKAPYANNCI